MEAIVITTERMEEVLPKMIKETKEISQNAKKILAAILNYYSILDIVKTTGFLICPNETLRKCVGIRNEELKRAIQELIDTNLIKREIGKARKKGQQSIASKYIIVWETFTKPLKKKNTFEDIFADFIKSSETPLGTVDIDYDNDIDNEIDDDSDYDSGDDYENEIDDKIENDIINDFNKTIKLEEILMDNGEERRNLEEGLKQWSNSLNYNYNFNNN